MSVPPPDAARDGCRILYRDIGDYLTRDQKLEKLRAWGSIAGIDDWQEIAPDRHHDWIGQRDEAFQALTPLGSKAAKAGRADDAIFRLFSNGYKTGRDAWVYNFSRAACADNARRMAADYRAALREVRDAKGEKPDIEVIAKRHSSGLHWDDKLKRQLRRQVACEFSADYVRLVAYRPFVKQHLYADYTFSQRPGQMPDIFPSSASENRAICVTGVGATKPFSALMVDAMPDLELISKGQCFPRWRFERRDETQGELLGGAHGLERVDNISETALRAFRVHYADNTITRDDVFDYVYGVLHAPEYRARFANDLAKALPRVPLALDFRAFAAAGARLAALHLNYETGPEYPLETVFAGEGEPDAAHFRIEKMKLADGGAALIVNEHLRLTGIPAAAHEYEVNGRTPLGWLVDRTRVRRDRESGLVNDPNGWFEGDPQGLIAAVRRIVYVSVETARIVRGLPAPFAADE